VLGDIFLRIRVSGRERNPLSVRFFLTLKNILKDCISVMFKFPGILLS